ncbi:MAG: hypothetical protein JXA95_00285 [Spirochaetales bacterium]|nr:hypothetical protein [Spirochaetales bacterium]
MKQTHFLTAEEKETGFSYILKHSIWNGLGYSFLTETIIYLMAIHFNATNVQLGYISSALFLSGLVLLVVPHLFGGGDMKQIFFWGWFLRGLFGLAYLSLFFVTGKPAVWIIMIAYSLFCIFRTLGVAAYQPVVKNLMSSSSEGSRLLHINSKGNRSALISRAISFAFLSVAFLSGLRGLILITMLGVITNTVASLFILKIPSREKVEKVTRSQGLLKIMAQSLKDRDTALHLTILWLYMAVSVLNGFIIPFLQKSAGIPSNLVFLYAVITVAGSLISNGFIRPYIDKTGSKPLLIMAGLILGVFFIVWALIPAASALVLFLLLGLAHSFFMNLGFNLTNRLLYKIIPKDKNRLTFSSMTSFAGALVALLTGLAAGQIADYATVNPTGFPHAYSIVFLIAGGLALLISLATAFISDQESISLREASELLYSRNRKVFLWTYQLATTEDPEVRESTLLSLEKSQSNLATKEMENQLNSPYSWERERILRSLYKYPRPDLAEQVLSEADDPHSYNRQDALFALASYPGDASEKVLLRALEDRDPCIASVALKSLVRLDKQKFASLPEEIYPRISPSSRARTDWFIAQCEREGSHSHLKNLFSFASPEMGFRYQQLIFCLAARYYARGILLAPYYQLANASPGTGIAALLEEFRDQPLFHSHEQEILRWSDGEENTPEILALMKENIPASRGEEPLDYIREAIEDLRPELINRSSFLALLFFSYQILHYGNENREESR